MKVLNIKDVFLIIRKVELKEKKKFAIMAFDLEYKVFIVYIAVFSID